MLKQGPIQIKFSIHPYFYNDLKAFESENSFIICYRNVIYLVAKLLINL